MFLCPLTSFKSFPVIVFISAHTPDIPVPHAYFFSAAFTYYLLIYYSNNFCQPMVSTNSIPTGSPIWDEVKKKTLFSVKQLNCDTAQLCKQSSKAVRQAAGARPLSGRQLCFVPCWSALLCFGLLLSVPV